MPIMPIVEGKVWARRTTDSRSTTGR